MTEALPTSTAHGTQQASAARAVQVAENAPRNSRVRFTVIVAGVGETRLTGKNKIQFGTLLLEEPSFTFGVISAVPIPVGQMPTATAVVLAWTQTKSGLFTAADVGFRVISGKSNIRLKFSLTFEGPALRSTAGVDQALGVTGTVNRYKGEYS